jgi:Arc/MetJ family transcription regulator
MRTTLNIDPELLKKAQEITHIQEKTSLIHEGLRALISQAARERLIALGGTDKKAKASPRRRST